MHTSSLCAMQEFSFPDAVRLWDTLFSDPAGRTDCLLRVCCAMLINVRGDLLRVLLCIAGLLESA